MLFAAALAGAGCASTSPAMPDPEAQRMLELVLPAEVRIVEPFTRATSSDEDAAPEGIELLIQAVNPLDDPGLMIVGHLRVEMFQHVPASAQRRGARLEHWDVDLTTPAQQKKYWSKVAQMYELRLGLDPSRIPPADKYVLAITYRSPFGKTLEDECVIHVRRTARDGLRFTPSPG